MASPRVLSRFISPFDSLFARRLCSSCMAANGNPQRRIRRYSSMTKSRDSFFEVSEEVRDALKTGKPVVALETTIYTHGFPYPENIALASHLESLVRVNGGIPATVGVVNGVTKVGLTAEELIELTAAAQTKSVMKISRRDLGYISGLGLRGKKMHGGTTIAGTMVLAHLAGVKVFATGGLGGVHRGGETSMDISADLTELGRTPVTVISSGCKSFLDIQRTLEYLETEGVVVGTFADGREGNVDFPAFFSRDSGIKSPKVIQDEKDAAAIIFAQSKFPLSSGIHFANPVPERASIPKENMDGIIAEAVRSAEKDGVHGADNTPYILDKIKELSEGKSVVANRALIEGNVTRATKVAVELAKLELEEKGILERQQPIFTSRESHAPSDQPVKAATEKQETHQSAVDIMVAGSLASDLFCDYSPLDTLSTSTAPSLQTSNPARISTSIGGVGHNVALAATLAGANVELSSVVSNDLTGTSTIAALKAEGLSSVGIEILDGTNTAQYIAVNDSKKDLFLAMADMSILESPRLDSAKLWNDKVDRNKPQWVVADGNWAPGILKHIVSAARLSGAQVAFEPVSAEKSMRLFHAPSEIITRTTVFPNHLVDLVSPNTIELHAIHKSARDTGLFESEQWWRVIDAFGMSSAGSRDRFVHMTSKELVDAGVPQQSIQLLPFLPIIVTKLGKHGALLIQLLQPGDSRLKDPDYAPYILSRTDTDISSQVGVGGVYMRLFPAAEVVDEDQIVSVNGVGDTLLGVLVAGLARIGTHAKIEDVISIAQEASVMTLKSKAAVGPKVRNLRSKLQML